MTGNRWTFLVLRDEGSPVRQYTLSTGMLRAIAAAGGVCLLVILAFVLTIGFDGLARLQARSLQARNEVLEAKLAAFQERMAGIEETLDRVASNDAHFRSIAGLEVIDPEVLQAGVGGPGLGSPQTSPLWGTDSVTTKRVFATTYDLAALERRARLLSESLEEATDSVVAHRDLLESTPSILPTPGWLSSNFSMARMHPIHNRPMPHEGVDISAPSGTPIYAAAKGKVIRAGWVVGYGLTVEIDHGYGFTTLYGHASKLIAQRGQEVLRGDLIAQVGSTGITTSSHLHYEVRVNGEAVNPRTYILPETVRH